MADEILEVGIEADASGAVRDMRAAADAAASLADSFREIASVAVNAARSLNKVEQGVTGTGKNSRQAAQGVQATTKALQEQSVAANTLSKNLLEVARKQQSGGRVFAVDKGGTSNSLQGYSKPLDYSEELSGLRALSAAREANMRKIRETVTANIAESKSARESAQANKANADALLQAQRHRAKRFAPGPNKASDNIVTSDMQGVGDASVKVGSSFGTIVGGADKASKSLDGMRESLFTARFALNDISRATGVAGAALLAFNAFTVKAAADYEKAFAAIRRTSGATASEMRVIQQQFVDLAQSVTGGFANLAEIGTLAGQLNIPTERIASFTETVAQFTSSTDVATQASAEAFGRLDTLLPDVQGNYEALGSSILNVGINSVATESSIISTTTQIAAAGAQARFTADEVIGLAASYASLGIAPEAARGSTIRIFSEIRQAAGEGGAALDEFARISGMSASEFQSAWATGDSSDLFMEFLKGLQKEGTAAEQTLRQLGITGVRDINALLRLSQNVDIVGEAFADANVGFSQATQLSEAFGITSQTLSARLEVMGQSFQALMATLGASGTGPIKVLVDSLIELLSLMTNIVANPAAQWIAVFGGIFTLLAGGALILTSLVARFGALRVAMITTRTELTTMRTNIETTNGSLTRMQGAAFRAGISLTQLSTIMKGVLVSAGIGVAITGVVSLITAIGDASKSSGDRAREAFGDLSSLTSALVKDTREVADGTQKSLGSIEGKITRITKRNADWVQEIEGTVGAQTSLATELERTNSAIGDQTYQIGQNTAAWLANQLVNNDAIVDMYKRNSQLAGTELEANLGGLIEATTRNDVDAAKAIIEEYRNTLNQFRMDEHFTGNEETARILSQAADQLVAMESAVNLTTGALQEAAIAGEVTNSVYTASGLAVPTATDAFDENAEAAGNLADAMQELRQGVSAVFSSFAQSAEFGDNVAKLFQGLAESGATAFSEMGTNAASNLSNLESAIASVIASGASMGVSAAESVAALFLELQRQGIDVANLLAALPGIPGIGQAGGLVIRGALDGTRQLSTNGTALANTLSSVAQQGSRAARSIGGGGRGVGGAAREAAKEVRTLLDYASDLQGVISRAFSIRFGAESRFDDITSEWISMRDAIKKANDEIAETQRRMSELRTENSSLTYFLGVAENYGDELRAAEIREQIAKNSADMAKEQEKAAEASGTLNKGLTGNTKSAIENRKQITGLVEQYQSLITAYAESGMDQAQLAQKTAQLRAQFVQEARQLGFNTAELGKYTAAFDDVRVAIDRVPRNITVDANMNPAEQALREFLAKANKSTATVNVGGGGGGYNLGQSFAEQFSRGMKDFLGKRPIAVAGYLIQGGQVYTVPGTGLKLYKQGGYTGGGNPSSVGGIVHKKEFVVDAPNTARLGLPFLNSLNSGGTPVAQGMGGGNGIQVVELSAHDRALLARAGDVSLSIDGKVIAGATNSANFVSGKRGSN